MELIKQLKLKDNEIQAIEKLKEIALKKFPDIEIIIFGSAARGESDEHSDIDLLMLLDRKITEEIEKELIHIAYDIELENNVVFGILFESKDFWSTDLSKAMPIHWNIEKEGMRI